MGQRTSIPSSKSLLFLPLHMTYEKNISSIWLVSFCLFCQNLLGCYSQNHGVPPFIHDAAAL